MNLVSTYWSVDGLFTPQIRKLLLSSAHLLVSFLPAIALLTLIAGDGRRRAARELSDGRIEFALSRTGLVIWAWIVIFLAYEAVDFLKHRHWVPLNLGTAVCLGLLALLLLFGFPGTVVSDSAGLQQVYWFRRNKRIPWSDIVEINTGKKVRTVTITGMDGTKIVHSPQLADRSRLLLEIKQHCGENLPSDFPLE